MCLVPIWMVGWKMQDLRNLDPPSFHSKIIKKGLKYVSNSIFDKSPGVEQWLRKPKRELVDLMLKLG
jgi:hypothetical protein